MGSDEMDPASPSPVDGGSERSSHASQPSTFHTDEAPQAGIESDKGEEEELNVHSLAESSDDVSEQVRGYQRTQGLGMSRLS